MRYNKTGFFLPAAFIFCVIFAMFLFPEILVWHNLRFSHIHDSEIPYENAFSVTSNFFQGGVQLLDRFDGFNISYSQMAGGVYTVANLLVAGIYLFCSPFFKFPAQAYHVVYSDGFYLITMLIRTIGGYLFLRKFSDNAVVLLVSLIYFNTIFTSPCMDNGLLTNNLFSYLPLILYYLICFFERYEFIDLIWFLVCMSLAVANSPLFALGYFYQFIHIFLISIILINLFRRHWPVLGKAPAFEIKARHVAAAVLVCLFLLLPFILIFHSLKSDFYIVNSGLGDTHGRIRNIFNVQGYMNAPGRSYGSPTDFATLIFDYTQNLWGQSWYYLGPGTIFIGLVGLILSKNYLKNVIVLATVLLLFLNIPPNPHSWMSFAHWINVLTNPFSFLVRSFAMSNLLWPMMFTGLLALGLQACFDLGRGRWDRIHARRLTLTLAVLVGLGIFFCAARFTYSTFVVTTLAMIIIFLVITRTGYYRNYVSIRKSRAYWLIGLFYLGIMSWDFKPFVPFVHDYHLPELTIHPRSFPGISDVPLILDYQNPKFYPFRYFYRQDPRFIDPNIYTYCDMLGEYYQYYSFFPRFIRPPDLYEPRYRIFKDFAVDQQMWLYSYRDGRTMFLADAAVLEDQVNFGSILNLGLDRRVIMVDGEHIPQLSDPRKLSLSAPEPLTVKTYGHIFDFSQASRLVHGQNIEYRFRLPDSFPKYISTTVFSQDAGTWSVRTGEKRLLPVQGCLTEPYTFDVNNVKDHELCLLLPRDVSVDNTALDVQIKTPGDIKDIWRNTNDNLGFDYTAPKDGWLMIHFPFDPKWDLNVDGHPTQFFQANRYFMAFPLSRGDHKILLRYWPRTPLRLLIALSALCAVGVVCAAFAQGLRRQTDLDILGKL